MLLNQSQSKEKLFNGVIILLGFAVFFSMASQVKELQSLRQAMNILWYLVLFVLLYKSRPKMEITRFGMYYLFFYSIFLWFCLAATLFFQNHLNTNIFKPFSICLFTYLVGAFLGKMQFPIKKLNMIILLFCFLTVCLSIYIRVFYLSNLSLWIQQTSYLYSSKNSAGQLIGVTVIFLLFYIKIDSRFALALKIGSVLFLSYVLVLIQCRTAILAVAFVTFLYVFTAHKGRVKYFFVVLCLVTFVVFNQTAWSILEKSLLLNGVERGIDTFSSGRLALYRDALERFSTHVLTGTGSTYVDNLYLAVLTENGVLGFFIIIPVWFGRIWCNFFQKLPEEGEGAHLNNLQSAVMLLTVFYIIESFFEALPPFGPGVCAFMLWVLSGYLDAYRDMGKALATDKAGLIRERPFKINSITLQIGKRNEGNASLRFHRKEISETRE